MDTRSGLEIAESHPLLKWYGQLHEWGVEAKGADIVLSTLAAARFAIGADRDGCPVLGVLNDDMPAVLSVDWKKASLLRNFKRKDWLALTTPDARLTVAGRDMPLRLFIPIVAELADLFEPFEGSTLRIRTMKVAKGKPVVSKGEPRAKLDFSVRRFD